VLLIWLQPAAISYQKFLQALLDETPADAWHVPAGAASESIPVCSQQ